jgi:hypothetical protein
MAKHSSSLLGATSIALSVRRFQRKPRQNSGQFAHEWDLVTQSALRGMSLHPDSTAVRVPLQSRGFLPVPIRG